MENKKLERWAQNLLDTGKRNNLINFKDTKSSTAEIVFPDGETFYEKCLSASSFEIYDPKIMDEEDEGSENVETPDTGENDVLRKEEYIDLYSPKIRKGNQVLAFAKIPNPISAVKNIDKKARDFLEETGVNVAYLAFGFVHWKEKETSDIVNRAPLLLVPIVLKNESAVTPYYIELTEDDVVVNPTFNFLLEAQYGIKLPEYEDDESLTAYLDKVREIVSKLHWEVSSECKLGIFSFLKINMYYDLVNNEETILKNKNVRFLLGEEENHQEAVMQDDVRFVDNEIIDLHTVVDADSSQIDAIEMAKSGKSFVLQGPPGTGKSQTITNIISECLHDGKKVMFVSEKQAALNVVYDKLKKVGLEEFCLELHSHKSSKKEVIAELCRTLRADRSAVSSRAYAEVEEKARLQEQLDSYAEELHKSVDGINKSMYQLYEAYAANRKAPDLDFIINDISHKGEGYLAEAKNLLSEYAEYIPTIGEDYRKNEWYGYKSRNGSLEAQNNLRQNLQVIISGLENLIIKAGECETEYAVRINTMSDVEKYAHLFSVLSNTLFLRTGALFPDKIEMLSDSVKKLSELSGQILTNRLKISETFEESVNNIDGQDYYNKLAKLYSGFFSRLFNSEYKKIISDIRLASKTGKKPGYNDAKEYMKKLADLQILQGQFDAEKSRMESLLNANEVSPETNWNQLSRELEIAKAFFDKGLSVGNIVKMQDDVFTSAKPVLGDYAGQLGKILGSFRQSAADLQNDFDEKIVVFEELSITALLGKMQACMDSIGKAENWVRFNNLLDRLIGHDLISFVDGAIDAHIEKEQIVSAYQKLFYKHWINHVMYEKPVFAGFTRISHDKAVEQFSEKDRLQFEISKAQIRAELSAKRPSLDMMAGGSAVSVLLREGEKKRKQKSIRKLLEETGELVQVLKPCFLMSPLSVSTFLSENSISFDTVVFDEASQIFPQDAIGAIYRASQLIVVGDSKQMPPSNFFNTSVEVDDEDEETGDVTDFESILDLCSATFPQLRLKWHYRSRYEQLISFSNKNFYDNSLVTFPSSTIDHEGIGVDYYHVDGLFDRKSHTNRTEAEFIVDLIYKNIDKYPNRSLGVVAFSVAQQELIEKLLSKKRQDDPSKEWFFKRDDSKREPFFVKNLETVQGDERDTIIFSVAYGKDIQGRLLHNFGPLNRIGGERRLNVAVTRAKENVQLVSSMHSTDIDLSRTSAEGARLLREYLNYAENGDIALQREMSVNQFEQFDSDFEMEVCEFLKDKGFTVDTQVGCSDFRIDLGLKKPDSSDYVLAIECDGATYHSSKNARDRDRLRQEILERMGWRFYRIWSTDWFRNNEVEKDNLLKAAAEAIEHGGFVKNEVTESEVENIDFEKVAEPVHMAFPEYAEADVESLRNSHMSDTKFFVKSILEIEAPTSEDNLLKRICFIYGREKVTSVVKDQFDADMRGCEKNGIIRKNGFLYLAGQEDFVMRVPGVKRDIKYIAPEELAAGLHVLLMQNITAEKDGLYRALANQLGFTRLGDAINTKLDEALALLNDVVVEGESVSIRK